MNITKLTSTDGFVAVDLSEAETSVGVVRCARKILQDGAVNLARTATYSFAAFGYRISGASAAINAEGETRDAAVADAASEWSERVASGSLVLRAGKGVSAGELAGLVPAFALPTPDEELDATATSIVATTVAVLEGASRAEVVIEEMGPLSAKVTEQLAAAGISAVRLPTAEALAAECAVLIAGSKPGLIDHEVAAGLGAQFLVASGPLPITARGLAVARRSGCEPIADFISLGGPLIVLGELISASGSTPDIAARVREVLAASTQFPDGPCLGACFLAEEFLRTWVSELPFGRPLA